MRERKVKLEVHIGRDHESRWWVIASVNDEEALQRGPYEDQATAEKEAVKLVAEFENVEDEEDLRRIIGTTWQLGTDDAGARRRGRVADSLDEAKSAFRAALGCGW